MSVIIKFSQNIFKNKRKRNFLIYHFLIESKAHERIDLLITASINIYQTKKCIPVVMKTCFSKGKLMKQFGNPPRLFVQILKTRNPKNLRGEETCKLPFRFKTVTPCSINECLSKFVQVISNTNTSLG